MDQEFHIIMSVKGNDHDQHHSRRNADGLDDKIGEAIKNHIQRAYVKYTVTQEIIIRKQIQLVAPLGLDIVCNVALIGTAAPFSVTCAPNMGVGGLTWEPGSAREDQVARAKAEGPKEVKDGKASKSKGLSVSLLMPLYSGFSMTWRRVGVTLSGPLTSAYICGWISESEPKSICKHMHPHDIALACQLMV